MVIMWECPSRLRIHKSRSRNEDKFERQSGLAGKNWIHEVFRYSGFRKHKSEFMNRTKMCKTYRELVHDSSFYLQSLMILRFQIEIFFSSFSSYHSRFLISNHFGHYLRYGEISLGR